MTPSRFRWGMLRILIGILSILQNNNVIGDFEYWGRWDIILPVVLIAIGIEKIFTKSKLHFISYLTTISLFVGCLALAFSASNTIFQEGNLFSGSIYRKESNPDLQLIKAKLNLDNNDLTIRDASSDLIVAEIDESSRKPTIETNFEDDIAYINMQARENSYFGGAIKINNGDAQDWNVQFSEDLPLDLECEGYDDDFHLNFQFSRLQRLRLDTENTTIKLKIGTNEPYVHLFIKGDDSKLRLRVPEKVGMKIYGTDTSFFNQIGFTEAGDGSFINANYNEANKKIDLELDDRLVSFSLDYF